MSCFHIVWAWLTVRTVTRLWNVLWCKHRSHKNEKKRHHAHGKRGTVQYSTYLAMDNCNTVMAFYVINYELNVCITKRLIQTRLMPPNVLKHFHQCMSIDSIQHCHYTSALEKWSLSCADVQWRYMLSVQSVPRLHNVKLLLSKQVVLVQSENSK